MEKMSYRTILVSLNEILHARHLLETTDSIARKADAYVIGLYAIPAVDLHPWSDLNLLQPDNNIDPGDPRARRHLRKTGDGKIRSGDVKQQFFAFDIVVEMVRCPGVEIGPMTLDCDFTQQAGLG
jgi:hypothetical protein